MRDLVDLEVYPLDRPDSAEWWMLVTRARAELSADGMCNLDGFLRPDAVALVLRELMPGLSNRAFTQTRQHNIYFRQEVPGLSPNHPATQEFRTANHTLCADQMTGMAVMQLYEWPGLARFLAATMGKRMLHTMADPLARVNVMAYHAGQALGWHFDRSEFTITLLLQAPVRRQNFALDNPFHTKIDGRSRSPIVVNIAVDVENGSTLLQRLDHLPILGDSVEAFDDGLSRQFPQIEERLHRFLVK